MPLKYEQIGAGGSKRAFADGRDRQKVVRLEFHENLKAEEMKSAYYLGKIAKLLFPNNVPDIYEAGIKPSSYLRTERIYVDDAHQEMSMDAIKYDQDVRYGDKKNTFTTDEVDAFLKKDSDRMKNESINEFVKIARDAGFDIDAAGRNFSIDDKKNVNYLEVEPAFYFVDDKVVRKFDEEKLKVAIDTLPIDKKDKALKYYNRLMEIIDIVESN